ncbi:hypothetical protein PVAND_002706 [Polypedilum vanderplanki]|uniref:Uncharacterized protein n=1 Tax=Polypedilum vanderplanki TaxID=319348 RepID=A0A9J6BTF4_POLVA|nr:hypothetical protein PVAND_002706 [Polypedilum vanderplanki]
MEVLKQNFKKQNTQFISSPKNSMVVEAILREANCNDYETFIINQMLQFTYRYVSTILILGDAKEFAQYCGRNDVILEDVKFAMTMMNDKIAKPIPREVLFELTKQKNMKPLPPITDLRIRLPICTHCLLAPNYIRRK